MELHSVPPYGMGSNRRKTAFINLWTSSAVAHGCMQIYTLKHREGGRERSTKCNGFMPAISALRKCANIYTQTQKNFMPTISALKRVKAKGSKV